MEYKQRIEKLIDRIRLPIDKDVVITGRPPTSATSEFLTNKEQGDWAERLVVKAINESAVGYVAVRYGRGDSIAAGDPEPSEEDIELTHKLIEAGRLLNIPVLDHVILGVPSSEHAGFFSMAASGLIEEFKGRNDQ